MALQTLSALLIFLFQFLVEIVHGKLELQIKLIEFQAINK